MVPFVKEGNLRPLLAGGMPVVYRAWEDPVEEKRLIETEVGRLVSQGLRPERIVVTLGCCRTEDQGTCCTNCLFVPIRFFRFSSYGRVDRLAKPQSQDRICQA